MLFNGIGSSESLRWPSVGKYKVDVASFESLALPELQVSLLSTYFAALLVTYVSGWPNKRVYAVGLSKRELRPLYEK